jgi:hypothetical protein
VAGQRTVSVRLEADVKDYTASLAKAAAATKALGSSTGRVRVDADTTGAQSKLAAVGGEVKRLDGQTARVRVDVDDTGATQRAAQNLNTLTATALAVSPALGSIGAAAVAGLGAIAPMAASAAAGLGVLALGFSGVGDTVKLLGQRHDAVAASAAKGAASQVSSAQQVQSAQATLANAQANAADGAIRSAERVADADRNLAKARQDAAEDVARAQQRAADDVESALQQQETAEKQLTTAQRSQRQAQLDLIDARREAQQQLEDLTASVEENALSQRQAVLDVADARAELDKVLNDPTATDAQREQARIDFEETVLRQQQLATQGKRLADQQADANKKGVEGSDLVVQAQDRVLSANEAVGDATRAVGDAAAEVDKARAQGAADVAKAQQDGAEKIADAQRQVADAVREQASQQRQAAFSIQQAQAAVEAAMTSAGTAGVSALAGIDAKLAEVGPSTRRFAEYVDGTLKPAFKRLQETAAAGLLPGVQEGLDSLLGQEPRITRFVAAYSDALGGLARDSLVNLSNPQWQAFFDMLETQGVPQLESMWHSGDNLAESLANILVAFAPMATDMAGGIEDLTEDFDAWSAGLADSEGFHEFEAYVRENWPEIKDIIANVADTVGALIEAGAPVGSTYLQGFALLSDVLAGLPVGVVQALLVAFLGFKSVQSVVGTINGVANSVLALKTNITGLPEKMSSIVGIAGSGGGKVNEFGIPLGNAADSAGRMSKALGGVTSALGGPWGIALAAGGTLVAGISADMSDASATTDAWAQALARGGDAAARVTEEAQKQRDNQPFEWMANLDEWAGFAPSMDDARQKAHDLWNEMTPLQQAQSKVAEWQDTLNRRMHDGSATSEEVRIAQERLTFWTGQVSTQQGELDAATGRANGALAEQKRTLEGLTGSTVSADQAEGNYWASVDRATQSLEGLSGQVVDANGKLDLHSEKGRAAQDSLYGMRDASNALIDKMIAQGATSGEVAAKDAQLRDTFIKTAEQMGISAGDAVNLANQILGIPSERKTVIDADISAASTAAASIQKQIDDLHGKTLTISLAAGTIDTGGGTYQMSYDTGQGTKALSAKYNAVGNLLGASPMPGGVAEIVPPNTLRVIGDRLTDDEAFIPINGSPRSRAILEQTASRMGYGLARPMADGGLLNVELALDKSDLLGSMAGYAMIQANQASQSAAVSAVPGPGGSVERWRPVVLQALAMLGQSASLANGVLNMIAKESGGNPSAINLWDSNAKAGHPSQGLMQTIPTTFAANRSPALPNNIVDPLANIYSGINYALKRYGPAMLAAGGRKSSTGGYLGYADGGTTPTHEPFWVGERGPELMWSSREQYVTSAAQSREFSGAAFSGGGGGSTDNSRQYVNHITAGPTAQDIARAVTDQQRTLEFLHG